MHALSNKKRRLLCQDLMDQGLKEKAHKQEERWVGVILTTTILTTLKQTLLMMQDVDVVMAVASQLVEEEEDADREEVSEAEEVDGK